MNCFPGATYETEVTWTMNKSFQNNVTPQFLFVVVVLLQL